MASGHACKLLVLVHQKKIQTRQNYLHGWITDILSYKTSGKTVRKHLSGNSHTHCLYQLLSKKAEGSCIPCFLCLH